MLIKSKYPVKSLIFLNLWLTSFFFLFGFVSIMARTDGGSLHEVIVESLLGSVLLILNSFINLALLLVFENRLAVNRSQKEYVILSYFFNGLVYYAVSLCYTLVNNLPLYLHSVIFLVILSFLINTVILTFQNHIILRDAKAISDLENSKLKAANADAANQLLRQQIHPHFLFNALNILKSLYKVNPVMGEEYLVRLSDFLRAAVSNNNIKVISLKDELKLCENYLEMQKIRFGNALICTISISENYLQQGFVPSFSIQPLLENAIKHNELTEESPLYIKIEQVGDRIKVTNGLKLKKNTEPSAGYGLANLSERYRILSNDELIIEDNSNTFSVSIKILSHENCYNRG